MTAVIICSSAFSPSKAIAMAALGYVRRNPDELVRAALNATGLRFGIPLAALRWFAEQLPAGKKTPSDIEITSAPPALRVAATIDAMLADTAAYAAHVAHHGTPPKV